MLGSALIVFREVLEAALIISIVMAATQGVAVRNRYVLLGILTGITGALIVASFAEAIASAMEGFGQELFNASILLAAVAMLAWHNLWMTRHAKALTRQLRNMGAAIVAGDKSLIFLTIAVSLAILREGSEVVLFMHGLAAGGSSTQALFWGGFAGALGGVAFGAALYWGLLRIPVQHLFSVTSALILFLAAGLASQAANYLIQADLLPSQAPLWDSSFLLPQDSWLGELLHLIAGYDAQPTPIQLAFYVTTFIGIGLAMITIKNFSKPALPQS